MDIILIPLENILAIECPLEIGRRDYHSSSNLFAHDQLHDDEGDYWKWVISQSEMGGPAVSLASLELRRFYVWQHFVLWVGGQIIFKISMPIHPLIRVVGNQGWRGVAWLLLSLLPCLANTHCLLLQKITHIKNTAFTESTLCHTAFAHGMLNYPMHNTQHIFLHTANYALFSELHTVCNISYCTVHNVQIVHSAHSTQKKQHRLP